MPQTTTNAVRDQFKSVIARFDGTMFEQPIAGAKKTFYAGIGLADRFRSEFETQFNALAADGEKARDRAQESAAHWRDQVAGNARTARQNVSNRVEEAVHKVLEFSPVATTDDVKKLNEKLDKVLAMVAK